MLLYVWAEYVQGADSVRTNNHHQKAIHATEHTHTGQTPSSSNLIVRGDGLQKVQILLIVEGCHVLGARSIRHEHFHLLVQTIVHHQGIGHGQSMRLHWVAWAKVCATHIRVVKVGDLWGVQKCVLVLVCGSVYFLCMCYREWAGE